MVQEHSTHLPSLILGNSSSSLVFVFQIAQLAEIGKPTRGHVLLSAVADVQTSISLMLMAMCWFRYLET